MKTEDAERILKLFADSLEQGKGFVLAEAPEVVQQLILWKRVESTVASVLWLAAIALVVLAICRVWKLIAVSVKDEVDKTGCRIFSGLVGGCAVVLSLAKLWGHFSTALQVWLAPKVYVLQFVADLLRQN